MEIHGPSKLLSLLEEKLSKVVISGLLPQMKEHDVDDEGEKIEPKTYVTTFGPENQMPNCQPSIIVKQVFPKSQNKLVHYITDEAGNQSLNESFPEISAHPSMLSIQTFKNVGKGEKNYQVHRQR